MVTCRVGLVHDRGKARGPWGHIYITGRAFPATHATTSLFTEQTALGGPQWLAQSPGHLPPPGIRGIGRELPGEKVNLGLMPGGQRALKKELAPQ